MSCCRYIQLAEAASLVVISEEDNSKLLVHKISKEDVYHRTDGMAADSEDTAKRVSMNITMCDTDR
jgi:hypothetical protein